eukprot:Seg3130.3 transcript_id=Seg3130.3/GoldUCD/mRNA.D3Y31 product=Sorcin protein_id=Seg3130.3/GoldUCD/D3Y31
MSGDKYVVKTSAGKAVLGTQFTLTLVPSKDSKETGIKGQTKDENSNLHASGDGSKQSEKPQGNQETKGVAKQGSGDVDDKFITLFKSVAGEDLEVDAFELQDVMGMIFKRDFGELKQFSIECCRSLVVMADKDRSGKLDYPQFKDLFEWVMEKRKAYKSYENGQSWDMDAQDLKVIVKSFGYKVKEDTIDLIAVKYRNKKGKINFDDFLQIVARLRACHDGYESYQIVGDSFDEFVMNIMYT